MSGTGAIIIAISLGLAVFIHWIFFLFGIFVWIIYEKTKKERK